MKDFRVGHHKHLKDQIDSLNKDLLKILSIFKYKNIDKIILPTPNSIVNAMVNSKDHKEAMNKIKSLIKK